MAKPTRRNRSEGQAPRSIDVDGLVDKYAFLRDLRSEVLEDLVAVGASTLRTEAAKDINGKMLVPIDAELERLAWILADSSTTKTSTIKAKALILLELLDQGAVDICLALARSVAEDVRDTF